MSIKTRATIEDLYKVEGKAELVNGEIVLMSPTGGVPGRAGGKIYRRLDVRFISSLPVMQRPVCKAWADTRHVQIVWVVS